MILTVDIGNTNIVLGFMNDLELVAHGRIVTDRKADKETYQARIQETIQKLNIEVSSIEGAIMSSVVPEVNEAVQQAVRSCIGKECLTINKNMKTDMPVLLDEPDTLAMDLIAGCVGAISEYFTPLIIIDMGTATTIVVVDRAGNYLGGAIVPGVRLSMTALANGTSLLPDIELKAPPKCIATNTIDSLQSGSILGAASMLDGMIDRMEEELGEKTTIVATGGISGCVIPHCRHQIYHEPDLLLKGLVVLYNKNKKD